MSLLAEPKRRNVRAMQRQLDALPE